MVSESKFDLPVEGEEGEDLAESSALSADQTSPPLDVRELLKNVTPELRMELRSVASKQIHFQGPIPDPETFKAYEQALPGAADRILSMTERQSKHRQEMEKYAIRSENNLQLVGLVFGLIVSLAIIVGGVWCILKGYSIAGTLLTGGALASLVGVFVYGAQGKKDLVSEAREEVEADSENTN
ncbi:DUF2335 domain-containing protein [Maridesulfovibrio hydrothermalis]|uniref:DUF2335 domain-containing protein n=1 Tax=Maridesulfovibrio hydrothermalis AM13 = DSM 14728 TaxID=1121451 RepID=L0RFA9_9BACT|nr:DUF2335 domain-containing protein [Maridesulfovibrio hydrothermalis]CCO25463.1 conserved protein of unknown function [Maridesulfovibrio hydrothermalis AM13 = DSM 14728]